jgi:hypothetical protein
MINAKVIRTQHPKNVRAIIRIIKGRLSPLEKIGRMA